MKNNNSDLINQKLAITVSVYSIIVNLLLTAFKLAAGIFASSSAMISDAVHSASDVFSTLIVIIGIKISNKESDKKHQYGHERLECVASIILSVFLFITGLGIGFAGLKNIFADSYSIQVPGRLALAAAAVAIIIKEAMFWYTRFIAKKVKSTALMADAWHHRSDSLSSIGSFVGIMGARIGFPFLDPLASIIICAFIIKVSIEIFADSVKKIIDEACDDNIIDKMKKLILLQKGVIGIDEFKTRIFGSKIYVDIEISANGQKTLNETHKIAEQVHDIIEKEFSDVKHCMVHVNPSPDKNKAD